MHHFDLRLVHHLALASITVLAVACGDDPSGSGEAVRGGIAYRDATTDHAGASRDPAAPPAQSATLTLIARGTATIPELDPRCAADPVGRFEARYVGSMVVDGGGAYTALIAGGSGAITTPSGCELPELTVGAITEVVVRAELDATTQTCQTYCQASARADAEQACGAHAAAASCRADLESQAAATCTSTCTTSAHAIAGEASVDASLLGELDVDALRAAAFGELEVDLVLDAMIDADGAAL